MFKQWLRKIIIISMMYVSSSDANENQIVSLSHDLAQRIGFQIWKNECGGKLEGLTTWNKGEDFASLGIGHFIWYPENQQGIFKETFPELLAFLKAHEIELPQWLDQAKGCPWHSQLEFEQAQSDEMQQELRQFLAENVDLQILFMVRRLNKALSTLLKYTPVDQHPHLTFQFNRLAQIPAGLYALLDYLNFKGEGIAVQESYQGKGWGLLQVLELLEGSEMGIVSVEEFVAAAKKVLLIRVEHAPKERQEKRWLKGWYNRLETYSQFSNINKIMPIDG